MYFDLSTDFHVLQLVCILNCTRSKVLKNTKYIQVYIDSCELHDDTVGGIRALRVIIL